MLLRLRLMLISLGMGTVLLMLLCLGAQNLKDRHSIQVGSARSVPLPTGFLVGLSMVIGDTLSYFPQEENNSQH